MWRFKVQTANKGDAKLWFTGAATPFIDKIRKIFWHNAKGDEQKQKIRDYFQIYEKSIWNVSTNSEVPGKSCWYTIKKQKRHI